jgi:RloB-like protein
MARKPKNSQGYSARILNSRSPKQRFLIVCEGTKTEPNYFRSFGVPKVVIDIEGLGRNPTKLVEYAIDRRSEDDFDQVWCVFDRDIWTIQDFQQAFKLAIQNKIQIAYSNEAFELWYILHFQFLNTAISRSDYPKKLSGLMGKPYAKNSREMYDELFDLQATAIANADRLLQEYPKPNPVTDNPSTTVHLLVQQLNRFI